MPPRYAYWTILIDDRPTAFRARERAELLPTLQQLKRTNPNAQMKWFARGKLWDTPEQAQWAQKHAPKPAEKRGRDWRPGGAHKDPRARPDRRPKAHGTRPSRAPARPWRRESTTPKRPHEPKRRDETPDRPPEAERIVIRPKPPERG